MQRLVKGIIRVALAITGSQQAGKQQAPTIRI